MAQAKKSAKKGSTKKSTSSARIYSNMGMVSLLIILVGFGFLFLSLKTDVAIVPSIILFVVGSALGGATLGARNRK